MDELLPSERFGDASPALNSLKTEQPLLFARQLAVDVQSVKLAENDRGVHQEFVACVPDDAAAIDLTGQRPCHAETLT